MFGTTPKVKNLSAATKGHARQERFITYKGLRAYHGRPWQMTLRYSASKFPSRATLPRTNERARASSSSHHAPSDKHGENNARHMFKSVQQRKIYTFYTVGFQMLRLLREGRRSCKTANLDD